MEGIKERTRHFDLYERKQIEKLSKKGLLGAEIAQAIKRSKNGVNTEMRKWRLSHPGVPYDGEKAHEEFLARQQVRYDNLSQLCKGREGSHTIFMRNLQEQVDILFELVKEIKTKIGEN